MIKITCMIPGDDESTLQESPFKLRVVKLVVPSRGSVFLQVSILMT